MVDIDRLRVKQSLDKIRIYEGSNDYILYLKNKVESGRLTILTQSQAEYIQTNFEFEPIILNKVVEISDFLATEIKKKHEYLKIEPKKIFVEKLLSDGEKSYHVLCKLFKGQDSIFLHLPKTQVITDLYQDDITIEVDFEKYENIDLRNRKLFDYQKDGVKFLLSKDKCILADQMGLGKTIISIISALEGGSKKILVVCPANAKINWKREFSCFIDENDISILKTGHWDPGNRVTIVNYDILKNFHTIIERGKKYEEWEINKFFLDEGFDLLIADESHLIKNPKSQRSKIINDIGKKIKKIWLLTGTPIANRPMDYFNLLNLCESPVTKNWAYYAIRYCAGKRFKKKGKDGKMKQIWVTDGNSNLEELHKRTKSIILRRMKDEHLNLPPKIVSPYYIELPNMSEYNNVLDEYIEWAKSEGRNVSSGGQLLEMSVLRKWIAREKVEHTLELVNQALEEGKKVIIFTCFTEPLNELKNRLGDLAVCHNGVMSDKEKQKSIDEFQNNPKKMVFIGNIISAGSAITLTAAEILIFNDLDFVPANHEQGESRPHRIGQTKTVNIYYPIFEGTIEEKIFEMLNYKKRIINTAVDGIEKEDTIISDFLPEILGKD